MSRLRIFADDAPEAPLLDTRDGDAITAELARIGVTFERWQASQPIAAGEPKLYESARAGSRGGFGP